MRGIRLLWAVTLAGGLAGQQETLRLADAVVIGELTSGAELEQPDGEVAASGVLRVRRVISGMVVPETELRLEWQYRPRPAEPPEGLEPLHGLWLLRGPAAGVWQPLPADRYLPRMGGVCLEFPRTEPVGDFFYPGDSPSDVRLARELAAALEVIAEAEGDRLNPPRRALRNGGVAGRITPAQARFQQAAGVLALAGRAASLPMYRRFAASRHANLRAVGLAGRMRAGDIEAVLDMERDAAALAPTLEAVQLGHGINHLAFDRHLPALHALGRTVLAETAIPNLEAAAAIRLGQSRRPEAFPYLAALLRSPDPYTRAQAVQGFCAALRPDPPPPEPLDGLWRPEMSRHCDPAAGDAAPRFWSRWWEGQRP